MHPSPPASQGGADPPGDVRPDRPAADAGGGRATFVNDRSPDAFEKVVDRLLASPHYGERRGRFWLDTARYSDTTGIENARKDDYRYAFAWTYRDYVIQALQRRQAVRPVPQGADRRRPAARSRSRTRSRLAALGFLTVGKRFQNPNDTIDERIDTVGKSTLAMTVACARCHDHKFDPIPHRRLLLAARHLREHRSSRRRSRWSARARRARNTRTSSGKLEALEAKNREIYYDLVATKSGRVPQERRDVPARRACCRARTTRTT